MKQLLIILILFCSFQGFGQKIVGYWRMNNGTSDASGNNYNGTPTSITYESGIENQSSKFNGTTSRIYIGQYPGLNGAMTVSVWVKKNISGMVGNFGGDRYSAWGQWGVGNTTAWAADGLERIHMIWGNGSTSSIYGGRCTLKQGVWQHIVITRDANRYVYMYVDSVPLIVTLTGGSERVSIYSLPQGTGIGCLGNYSGNNIGDGNLDDFILINGQWSNAFVKNEFAVKKGFF